MSVKMQYLTVDAVANTPVASDRCHRCHYHPCHAFLFLLLLFTLLQHLLFRSRKLLTMWRVIVTVVMVVAINMKRGESIDRKPFGGVWDMDGVVKTDGDPNLVVQVRIILFLQQPCLFLSFYTPTSCFSPATLVLWRYAVTTLITILFLSSVVRGSQVIFLVTLCIAFIFDLFLIC